MIVNKIKYPPLANKKLLTDLITKSSQRQNTEFRRRKSELILSSKIRKEMLVLSQAALGFKRPVATELERKIKDLYRSAKTSNLPSKPRPFIGHNPVIYPPYSATYIGQEECGALQTCSRHGPNSYNNEIGAKMGGHTPTWAMILNGINYMYQAPSTGLMNVSAQVAVYGNAFVFDFPFFGNAEANSFLELDANGPRSLETIYEKNRVMFDITKFNGRLFAIKASGYVQAGQWYAINVWSWNYLILSGVAAGYLDLDIFVQNINISIN